MLEKKHFSVVQERILLKSNESEIMTHDENNMNFDSLNDAKEYAETVEIKKALLKANGNKSMAAKLLKVDRSVLYEKMKKYNIT